MKRYLNVAVDRNGVTTVVQVEGELDLGSSPALELEIDRALRAGSPSVLVDVRGLRFVDMAGLRVLLSGQERARQQGRLFGLTGVREPIRRILRLARVDDLLVLE